MVSPLDSYLWLGQIRGFTDDEMSYKRWHFMGGLTLEGDNIERLREDGRFVTVLT